MNKSKIEWCDYTWNPVTGCYHGCEYCYAEKIAQRFASMAYKQNKDLFAENFRADLNSPDINQVGRIEPFPYGFKPVFHRYRLGEPLKFKKSSKIFVSSMGDLFGEWVPDEWIEEVFKACEAAPQHTYMFLTKNPERYCKLNGKNHRYDWSYAKSNWWFGITVTCQNDLHRLRYLPYGSTNTFISIEPLQDSIDLSFYIPQNAKYKCSYCGFHAEYYSLHCQNCGKDGGYSGSFRKKPIDWVIIGAQTGPGAKPPKPEWVQSIIDQCRSVGVPVFLKDNLNWPEKIQEYREAM